MRACRSAEDPRAGFSTLPQAMVSREDSVKPEGHHWSQNGYGAACNTLHVTPYCFAVALLCICFAFALLCFALLLLCFGFALL